MKIKIDVLMQRSGVGFGTSGARGRSEDITDFVAYTYTRGFIQYLQSVNELKPIQPGARPPEKDLNNASYFIKNKLAIGVAGDLRPSTDRIIEAVCRAIESFGYLPIYCGKIPSPALALFGFKHSIPTIMVTGSHIPADRNGIKFNKPNSELLKEDELPLRSQIVDVDESQFDSSGFFVSGTIATREVDYTARNLYIKRYTNFFCSDSLKGLKIGVYQHSAVAREILVEVLEKLGAEVMPLGASDEFIPVDTEAIRETDIELARKWANEFKFDSIVSTDGDSDRPLISDEHGRWLRGDIVGLLCAKYLQADSVSVPVSCNTAIEKSGFFKDVRRTRIGSPYVIASTTSALLNGYKNVVGFEANGGFILQSRLVINGKSLEPLPTRDSLLPILSILVSAKSNNKRVSELVKAIPQRFTASNRLENFPQEKSRKIIAMFEGNDALEKFHSIFNVVSGEPVFLDRTDGIRVTFKNGEIIHLRPSGNAPEFRCYTEADTEERALQMNKQCLEIVKNLKLA